MLSSALGFSSSPAAVDSEAPQNTRPGCQIDAAPERRRVQELLRYYQPSAEDVHNVDLDNVRLSPDPTLTALVQVGALRTDCDRSFLSLMTKESQHILAEATRTISLVDKEKHGPGDRVFLGARTLDLEWGVCPSTIKVFTCMDGSLDVSTANVTANSTSYVMNDMSLESCFQDRPYVQGFPHMKFYAEVPLETSSGYVIGSYCVVDNRRRENEDHEEILSTIREVASTIMNHLELVQFKQTTLRAERMVNGLSNFVAGAGSLNSSVPPYGPSRSSSQENVKDRPSNRVGDSSKLSITNTSANPVPLADNETPPPDVIDVTRLENSEQPLDWTSNSSETFIDTESTATSPLNISPGDSYRPKTIHDMNEVDLERKKAIIKNRSVAPSSVSDTLSRASSLIREAIDLDGVMFVDASLYSHYGGDYRHNGICSVLSCSTRLGTFNGPNEETRDFSRLTEPFLSTILAKAPAGGVFYYDDAGFITGTRKESSKVRKINSNFDSPHAAATLTDILPGARSIAIWPLKHPDKASWLAVGFAWSSDSHSPIRAEDFTYLRAFGNSIMVEISRLEIISADKAKSNFLSSISHELRSPLHGVLANTELLAATTDDLHQCELISSIDVCGRTLLDTMNHLLDYAKINNFNNAKGGELEKSKPKGLGLTSTFDMSTMVQDVVQGVLSGHRHYVASTRARNSNADSSSAGSLSLGQTKSHGNAKIKTFPGDDLMVILDIESRLDWTFISEAGAWKRILMNIFGNALKYTDQGFVKVSLRGDEATKNGTQTSSSIVTLEVSDSGRGMSPEYLKNNLFTPFLQEDILSVGAGLGLSIVHQIVTSLGGTIQVDSEQFVGTTITISIPLESPTASIQLTENADSLLIAQIRDEVNRMSINFAGLRAISNETPSLTKTYSAQDRRLSDLASSLSQMAAMWFGLSINKTLDLESASGDFILTTDAVLGAYLKTHDKNVDAPWEASKAPIIVLRMAADEDFLSALASWDVGRVAMLTIPIGPRRFAKALGACQRYRTLRARASAADSKANSSTTSKGSIQSPHDEQVQELTSLAQSYTISNETTPFTRATNPPELVTELEKSSLQGKERGMAAGAQLPGVLNLLLVEDNEINLKILVTYMKSLKHSFTTATNGLQALEAYKAATLPFDYVIMDISMPVMDGYTSTRGIRAFELQNSCKPVPIIALTGLASASAQHEAFSCGVTTFLTKPVRLAELKKIIGS